MRYVRGNPLRDEFLKMSLQLPEITLGSSFSPFLPMRGDQERNQIQTCRLSIAAKTKLQIIASYFGIKPATLVSVIICHYLNQISDSIVDYYGIK